MKQIRLLSTVPSKSYDRLVVRYPYQTTAEYAHAYHFSAKRLASTFSGDTVDDLILLPFLTLYRQAFELQLKNAVGVLVGLRIRYLEGRIPELIGLLSEESFKKKLGHNLHRLLNEVQRHFAALDLPERFPGSLADMIKKLHEADQAGTAFRYAGLLPAGTEHVDFLDLSEQLDVNYELLGTVIDFAEGCYEPMPTFEELSGGMY